MASSSVGNISQVPRVHHFDLIDGMQLEINISGSAGRHNTRIEFKLKNGTRTWILHWGFLFRGNKNWFIAADNSSGRKSYKHGALQSQFVKHGQIHIVIIELRDPNIHAIEFVLKDGHHNRWLKLNHGNFRIEIPASDVPIHHSSTSNELAKHKAESPQPQKQGNNNSTLREILNRLSKGISLNEPRNSYMSGSTKAVNGNWDLVRSGVQYSYKRKYNVEEWLQKHSGEHPKRSHDSTSALVDLVERFMGGTTDLISWQRYCVHSYEIVVFSKIINGDYHIFVAANTKGTTVLHWGVSKSSPCEWLVPPTDIWPENSKQVSGACQSYFTDKFMGNGSFQVIYAIALFPGLIYICLYLLLRGEYILIIPFFLLIFPSQKKVIDVNLQKKNFVGIQFVIWTGGFWIKNSGAKFFAELKRNNPTERISQDMKVLVVWLLNEIAQREREAERSLMHRFNIATELTARCKSEGGLGLIGILVWLRFMACRHLTWNKNYNVKPREISEAQDRFTFLLQKIYLNQPSDREIVRLIMACVGRGGAGDVGQRIRDEILLIQRNYDCRTGMMEEWHQKLHNNSSPDDIIICEALINYVRCGFRINVYWETLNANGLTKEKLASYDRPIVSEPHFRSDLRDGLIRDLTAYLKTLKAVHAGVDLESAIDICLGSSFKDGNVENAIKHRPAVGLPLNLLEGLNFVKAHFGDINIGPLMEKLLESRIMLRPFLLTSHGRLKDLLFLDISLDSAVRATMERGIKNLNFAYIPEALFFFSLMLENLCLSTVNNEDFIYCTKDWYHVCESFKSGDSQWALRTKAILDRLQLVLAERSQHYQKSIQPSAQYLGKLLGVQKWAIDIFTEELIRSGCSAILSILINRFDPILRKVSNLGSWQVISPVEVSGFVTSVHELMTIQNKVYKRPTIIVASRISGEEEIPEGVVAVLTTDTPDVLSHISLRARNSKVCFATCFDKNTFQDLKSKEGKAVSIKIKSTNLVISDIISTCLSHKSIGFRSIPRGVAIKKKTFCGNYAVLTEEFTGEKVGAKSCNIKLLNARITSWIKIPMSLALSFGSFETALQDKVNKDVADRIHSLCQLVDHGDHSKLRAIQEAVLEIHAPLYLTNELKRKMRSSRLPWPGDEGEERWNCAWKAIKKVWASKWNERAFLSCHKAKLNHGDICMAVLIQEVICGDYAFVIHTNNPISGDATEIYAEIVKGLGESLVGAYPGRAMTFTAKKTNLKSPTVTGYPSKLTGLYSKKSIIFRSDSNAEDLEGFSGAGLFDSVIMEKVDKVVLDYSRDPIIVDKAFQTSLLSRIAEAGKIIEDIYGCPQDIEGVVKAGTIFVVQARPQI